MNHYPIAISGSDTGSLGDYFSKFANQQPVIRVSAGAAVGALVGKLSGKHTILGALIGAAGGYLAAGWNSKA